MNKTLEIDMYKDGFSIESVDCVHGPIAAATGYYSYEYYFYYNFLHCIYWQTSVLDELELSSYASKILKNMGLELKEIDCIDLSDDEAILNMSKTITGGMPIVLVTKYNALFYSMWYKNNEFKTKHAIIINEYLETNRTFGIKESTLLRGYIDSNKNTDSFFQLHITDTMLFDIWVIANKQFCEEQSPYYKKFYAVIENTQASVDPNTILTQAIKIFDNWNNGLSNIICIWNNELINSIDDYVEQFRDYRLRYCGSLKPIYSLLYSCCEDNTVMRQNVAEIEERHTEVRRRVINVLQASYLRNTPLSEEKVEDLNRMLMNTDNEMISLIKSFIKNDAELDRQYHYIDISGIYNNQAFDSCISNDSVASISHNGIYFIVDKNLCCNKVWNQRNFKFLYSYNPEQYDNVYCNGQTIICNVEASEISILACAEYGDFQVPIKLEFENGKQTDINADFSDFYQPPKYKERTFWSGVAAEKSNGEAYQSSFCARLFSKSYKIKKNVIKKIQLPVCKNVHIFAITLINY